MKKNCCLLTYIHNEYFFFPIFLKYYSKIFQPDDIFVLENNCDKDFVFNLRKKYLFNSLLFNTQYNHDFCAINLELTKIMTSLLEKYHSIFISECDEILYHPAGLPLVSQRYLQLPHKVIRSMGFEPIHDYLNQEPAIKCDKPLLNQRKLWWDTPYFRKPVFVKQPIDYWSNMHNYDETYTFIDSQLLLIHLKLIDYDKLYERNCQTLKEGNFAIESTEKNKGWQNRIDTKDKFDLFFTENFSKCVPIPEKYKLIC